MFDIGKKGVEKGQDSGSREERSAAQSPASERPQPAPRTTTPPASGSREAAVIGPSIHIDGDLRGDEDLIIEGEVNGTVQLKNNSLTIGAQGKVSADVYAHSVYVEGYTEGDLYGFERVAIRNSAQVRGNITSPRVGLDDGARFKGTIEMDPQAVEAALGKRKGSEEASGPAPVEGNKPVEGNRPVDGHHKSGSSGNPKQNHGGSGKPDASGGKR